MNIGLVLSGGMAKGAYQIGALKALDEYIPVSDFKYVSCSSVGVLNGYSYITGKLDKAEEMWRNVCNEDDRQLVSKILRSSFLQQSIKEIYSKQDVIHSTFYISLLDINRKTISYNNLKNVPEDFIPLYLKASVAMPIYNRAVKICDENYFDGAIIDNIPVFPLLKHTLDYIICIYFDDCCYKFENTYFDNKIIKITFPIHNLLRESVIFKKDSIEEMFEQGYKTASYLLKPIFANGIEDTEYIYDCISYMNEQNGERKLRLTGDVLVTNINKITQKFARRKIRI